MNKANINIHVQFLCVGVNKSFHSLRKIPRRSTAESCREYMLNSIKKKKTCQTVSHSGYYSLHSHQQRTSVLAAPRPREHLVWSVVGVCVSVVCTCSFLCV